MTERTPTNINMSNNIFILFLMLNVECLIIVKLGVL